MTTMTHGHDDMNQVRARLRARNVRTGLILAVIALALFIGFIIRTWYLAHG